jgi:hypothetical protein
MRHMFLLYLRVPYATKHQTVYESSQDVRASTKYQAMDLIAAMLLTMCYVAHRRRNCS